MKPGESDICVAETSGLGPPSPAVNCTKVHYDEQLHFKSKKSSKDYSKVHYILILDNGDTVQGRTDYDGKTKRIVTDAPRTIKTAILQSTADSYPQNNRCCVAGHDVNGTTLELNNVTTHAQDFGTSVKVVEVTWETRPLTAGEIAMAQKIFKDSIDYGKVKVHKDAFLPGQNADTVMTPNGEMYYNGDHYRADYSVDEEPRIRHLFIHEMVHVWQYQLGYGVAGAGMNAHMFAKDPREPYQYSILPDQKDSYYKIENYKLEPQGEIIADYYMMTFEGPPTLYASDSGREIKDINLFRRVLKEFLENPGDKKRTPLQFRKKDDDDFTGA